MHLVLLTLLDLVPGIRLFEHVGVRPADDVRAIE